MTHRIFISSVQKEFAEERRLLKRYISKNPAYRRFFDTFVFEEDVVATDRRTDEVYLDEIGKCDIYLGLIGGEYGFEDAEGVSPTEPVIAEAIVNAIAHRDYNSTGSVQVELFSDKLLIMNPGALNSALRPGDLLKRHASYPNNPRIAEPLFFAKYIEKLGSGITDLIDACRETGLGDPEFDISSGTFSIVIHRRNSVSNVGSPEGSLKGSLKSSLKSSLKILEILTTDPYCTYDALAEMLGISRRAVTKHIRNLRKEGKLRRIGPDKGGHWEVTAPRSPLTAHC